MTALAFARPPRCPTTQAVGLSASLALHALAALALVLLARPEPPPVSEPRLVELVIEHVAASEPAAPPPEATAIDLPLPDPAPPVEFEIASEAPRRKPTPSLPSRAAAGPVPTAPSAPQITAVTPAPPAIAPAPVQPEPQAASRYGAVLLAWLERYSDYPRAARLRRQEGKVMLRLTIDRAGRLLAAEIAETSGFELLDQAALDTARRAAPLPPLPAEEKSDRAVLLVPVLFALSKG